jgi:hypothetical protein
METKWGVRGQERGVYKALFFAREVKTYTHHTHALHDRKVIRPACFWWGVPVINFFSFAAADCALASYIYEN